MKVNFKKMKKKYDIKEKGTDFWGRRKFEITERSSDGGEALGYLFIGLLGLAVLTLPSGIIALAFYLIGYFLLLSKESKNIQEKKERLAWISTVIAIIICVLYYIYFFDFRLDAIKVVLLFIVLGVVSYFILYKLVVWSTYSGENKLEYKIQYISYLFALLIFFFVGLYNLYHSSNCLISHEWKCVSESSRRYSFSDNGEFVSNYAGGWSSGTWEPDLTGDVEMIILDGSDFRNKVSFNLDFIDCGEFKIGETVYVSDR